MQEAKILLDTVSGLDNDVKNFHKTSFKFLSFLWCVMFFGIWTLF